MKFKIEQKTLLEGLAKVSNAISSKSLIPILSGIKFELTSEGLYLIASDSDMTIKNFIKLDKENIQIEELGGIVIPKNIIEIVRKLEEQVLEITVLDGVKILIKTKSGNFYLNGYEKEEYPKMDLSLNKKFISINAKKLKEAVNQISFASSRDEGRPILTGINLRILGDKIELNATDSYRLARNILDLKETVDESYNIVVPTDNFNNFLKTIEVDSDVELHIFNNKIIFNYENLLFQSRLISGNYPFTSNLLPKEKLISITLNKTQFYNVVDRAALFTSDKEKNIISLIVNKNTVVVKSGDGIGQVDEKIDINGNVENEFKIDFSSRYMMDSVKTFKNETITLTFLASDKPIVISDKDSENLMHLVLPIRSY